jgi:hypothetical protein
MPQNPEENAGFILQSRYSQLEEAVIDMVTATYEIATCLAGLKGAPHPRCVGKEGPVGHGKTDQSVPSNGPSALRGDASFPWRLSGGDCRTWMLLCQS